MLAQIERLLTELKLEIDEARTIDEDPNMREAVSDIFAWAIHEGAMRETG